jgi:hypothetical protein
MNPRSDTMRSIWSGIRKTAARRPFANLAHRFANLAHRCRQTGAVSRSHGRPRSRCGQHDDATVRAARQGWPARSGLAEPRVPRAGCGQNLPALILATVTREIR